MVFRLNPVGGSLQPGEFINISATFQAAVVGAYRQGYSVMSGDDTILKFSVMAHVGVPNLASSLTLLIWSIQVFRKFWSINAGHSSLIRVDFNPLHEGQFKCVAKIIWSNNPILITIMGIGGGCKLDIEFDTKSDKMFGGLDFGICPVGLAVSKNVKITNIGTVKGCLELSHRNSCVTLSTTRDDTGGVYFHQALVSILPFDVKIEPIELASVVSYSLSGDNWIEGRPLRPKQTAAVLVKAISDHQSIVDDIDVGRVMIGESATVIRSISNFGNSKTRYRIQIERNDGDTKPTSWSIKSASDGYLEAGENNTIEVVFESLDGFGDDWQQENMIIELCSGDNLESWLFFSKIKLIGASGHASLEFEPSEIDFGPTGIGSEKTMQMTFRNDGNAVLNYEVQTPWESSDEVTLSLGFSLKGAIKAKEVLSTLVTFSPVFSTNYSTLSMENDCNYDIDVSVIIYEENPSEVDYVPKRSSIVNILPKTIRIKGNDYEGSRSKALFTVRASANIQYTESGLQFVISPLDGLLNPVSSKDITLDFLGASDLQDGSGGSTKRTA
ncbi:hypothetical protein BASA83_007574 [Batrachochytrium salamandrivorans]|nr:hypothetical protein BASA83_007574 [Batrachochytrium salamandrivorans]